MNIDLSTDAPPSPERTLQLADTLANLVRVLNHQTRHHEALRYPSDADRFLREIERAVSGFPQLLGQVSGWIRQEQDAGRIEVSHGDYAGDPRAACAAAVMRLEVAQMTADTLRLDVEAAASVTSTMGGVED